ncbi:DUF2325 domain-containing protein [Parageobacillus thermoglucosidasius]|uniref:DUF2325 domain-containing protein n=1 Tax=Parageobacillus thermoglucosidasius TaxID=1426 RepID=A0AB38R3V3_PARTM|nr:DUF2325 domain-containing protein [Parageobacillus thermoglucosidasius]UOE78394.1 DUF2325 domain-containing protein [Parageobacillus thermoglucosidasius]
MVDIRPFLKQKLHVTVWFKGTCKYCGYTNVKKVYDYGVMTFEEFDRKLDETGHKVEPIACKKCGSESMPERIVYREEMKDIIVSDEAINYGHEIVGEEVQEAHQKRYEIFDEQKEEFWEKYTDYAVTHWRDMINELVDFEFQEAYQKLGIETNARTVAQYRKDALNRFKTVEEKQRFWREANDYFIHQHLLDVGPLGWALDKDVKYYGQKRMRFIVLHFPLGEALEELRTEWIGQLIKKEKGDNDFLFRRIAMLTDELNRTRQKVTKYVHQVEELKAEQAKLQDKLSEAYEQLRKERENKNIVTRDPADVEKIRELKSFVSELIGELKEKDKLVRELQPAQEEVSVPELEEAQVDAEQKILDTLVGKTVAIIGGRRQEQAQKEYPCTVLAHSGEVLNPDFYYTLKQADIIIVLTQFVSHLAMWEAKAYALQNDVPIYFLKGLNIPRLLAEVAEQIERS